MPDTGPAENEEAQRPRFTPRALLGVRDLLRQFQAKVGPSSTSNTVTANEADPTTAPDDGEPNPRPLP